MYLFCIIRYIRGLVVFDHGIRGGISDVPFRAWALDFVILSGFWTWGLKAWRAGLSHITLWIYAWGSKEKWGWLIQFNCNHCRGTLYPQLGSTPALTIKRRFPRLLVGSRSRIHSLRSVLCLAIRNRGQSMKIMLVIDIPPINVRVTQNKFWTWRVIITMSIEKRIIRPFRFMM